MLVVRGTRGEEQLVMRSVRVIGRIAAEKMPQTWSMTNRLIRRVAQSAQELAGAGIEGIDTALRDVVGDQ